MYVDPGNGLFIVQGIIATFVGIAFTARNAVRRLFVRAAGVARSKEPSPVGSFKATPKSGRSEERLGEGNS